MPRAEQVRRCCGTCAWFTAGVRGALGCCHQNSYSGSPIGEVAADWGSGCALWSTEREAVADRPVEQPQEPEVMCQPPEPGRPPGGLDDLLVHTVTIGTERGGPQRTTESEPRLCGNCGWYLDGACHECVPTGGTAVPIRADERNCGFWTGEQGLAKQALRQRPRAKRWKVRVTAQARVDYIVKARSADAATREVWRLTESSDKSVGNPLYEALLAKLGWFGVQDAEPVRRG